jgi:hypothetical protein
MMEFSLRRKVQGQLDVRGNMLSCQVPPAKHKLYLMGTRVIEYKG